VKSGTSSVETGLSIFVLSVNSIILRSSPVKSAESRVDSIPVFQSGGRQWLSVFFKQ